MKPSRDDMIDKWSAARIYPLTVIEDTRISIDFQSLGKSRHIKTIRTMCKCLYCREQTAALAKYNVAGNCLENEYFQQYCLRLSPIWKVNVLYTQRRMITHNERRMMKIRPFTYSEPHSLSSVGNNMDASKAVSDSISPDSCSFISISVQHSFLST